MKIQGKYTSAEVFAPEIEETARQFVQELCDHPAMAGVRIAQMPDVHAGRGCNVGTAYAVGEYVNPEHVGVDIGCTISMHRLSRRVEPADFALLDHGVRGQRTENDRRQEFVPVSRHGVRQSAVGRSGADLRGGTDR